MALWLVRAGGQGQHQDLALNSNTVVIGWHQLGDLSDFKTRDEMKEACSNAYPNAKPGAINNWVGQLWAFVHRIEIGNLVALPLKGQDAVAFGKVTGEYVFNPDNHEHARHTRAVEWITQDMPREQLDQDILYSLGAFMTVCQIKRNDAEERVKALLKGEKYMLTQDATVIHAQNANDEVSDDTAPMNLEESAETQLKTYIRQNFTGHDMANIIDAILVAQGYQTHVSPPGPDGGVDILAGRGPLGFDPPRLCVQVKATGNQQDIKVIRELKGVMKDFGAEHGLFVSWSGYKRSVLQEAQRQYFDLRLWDAGDIVKAIQKYYDQFSEDLKAELPLKRVWMLVQED